MGAVDRLYKSINFGKEGKNIGVPTSLPKLDKITYGIQQSYIYTVMADTGGGKTTYTLFSFVYNALKNYITNGGKPVQILYFSIEMSSEVLLAKLLSLYLWDNYGQVITFEEILSLTSEISEEKLAYIYDAKAWMDTVEQYITIIDNPISPEQGSVILRMWNEKFGKFIQVDENQEVYKSDFEGLKIVVTDHVSIMKNNGKGTKNTIDEWCKEYINYRNLCGITGVLVQQANRNFKGMDRRLNDMGLFQLDDLKDSSDTAQASEVVIGIYNPHREKLNKVNKYNVKILEDRIRVVQVMKNRYGQSDKNICVNFHGDVGWFMELPPAEEINDYEQYLSLQNPHIEAKPVAEVDTNAMNFNFTM